MFTIALVFLLTLLPDSIGAATCSPTEFECTNGDCVSLDWTCDYEDDCGDNSDESNCPVLNCTASEFSCANGYCVDASYTCDTEDDCGDDSDEIGCRTSWVTGEGELWGKRLVLCFVSTSKLHEFGIFVQ
eukprot:m.219572 g.219572  ORF g.219572 m.219572 type:complete len:130 (+) comp39924_c0_seq45:362-751(+)